MKYFSLHIFTLIVASFISKCSSSIPETLEGRCFWSVNIMEDDEEKQLVPNTHIELCFQEEGNIRASAGCNQIGSTCTIGSNDILDCGMMFSTMMWCGEELSDQDTFVTAFLESKPLIVIDGNNLGMISDDVVITFLDKKEADPDRPLIGTEWRVEGFVLPDAEMSISVEFGSWAVFGDDSVMSWFDGCSESKRTFSNFNDLIRFGDLEGEPADCDDKESLRYAGFFNAMFNTGEATYTIDGPSLRIVNDEGHGVRFQASSGGVERRAFNEGYFIAE